MATLRSRLHSATVSRSSCCCSFSVDMALARRSSVALAAERGLNRDDPAFVQALCADSQNSQTPKHARAGSGVSSQSVETIDAIAAELSGNAPVRLHPVS